MTLPPERILTHGRIVINDTCHIVTVAGKTVYLSPNEYRVLLHLAERPGQVVSQLDLQLDVLRYDVDATSTAARTTVSRLRRKLGGSRDAIRCVRCFGYVLEG